MTQGSGVQPRALPRSRGTSHQQGDVPTTQLSWLSYRFPAFVQFLIGLPGEGPMALCVWLLECARCHQCVLVCTRCLGGRRYCDPCREQAREESLRDSGRRYQQTDAGREKHRLRQQRWREGRREGAAIPATAPGNEAGVALAELPQGATPEGCPPDVTHQRVEGSGEHGAKLCRAPEPATYVAVENGADGGGHETLQSSHARAPAGLRPPKVRACDAREGGWPARR